MSGAATPHDPSSVITTCDGLRLMQQNVAALVDLRARQERLMGEAMQLQQDMVDFCAATRQQVAALMARTPLDLRPQRSKVNLDDDPESTEAERLPPPLQPQVVNHAPSAAKMCRSLSDFLSNLTETACTNSPFAPTATAETTSAVLPGVDSAASPLATAAKTPEYTELHTQADVETFKPDVAGNEEILDVVTETPAVSPTAVGAVVSGAEAGNTVEDSSVCRSDDDASVSSLLLDSTMTGSAVDISLLDDPFIAIGAGYEKDSLLEEPDVDRSWTTADDSNKTPVTSSPVLSAAEKSGSDAASLEVASASAILDTDAEGSDAVASGIDDAITE